MGWETGRAGGGGEGKHAGGKDPGTAKPSPDTAQPRPGPKHGK
ncbi:hypothetical protein [Streptomyces sp. 35G-GA-8]|nr:hypothetical protein [Streptomyces sp. 35G-GA-8]